MCSENDLVSYLQIGQLLRLLILYGTRNLAGFDSLFNLVAQLLQHVWCCYEVEHRHAKNGRGGVCAGENLEEHLGLTLAFGEAVFDKGALEIFKGELVTCLNYQLELGKEKVIQAYLGQLSRSVQTSLPQACAKI